MSEWMYAHSLPVDMHPQGCTCGGCDEIVYQPIDVWQLDKFKQIMLSNAGSTPLHADLHLGSASDWDAAYNIAQPIAELFGYEIIEHDISDDESELDDDGY